MSETLAGIPRSKAPTRQRFAQPVALTSSDRPEKITDQLMKMVELLRGRG